jgi:hypothetical protein
MGLLQPPRRHHRAGGVEALKTLDDLVAELDEDLFGRRVLVRADLDRVRVSCDGSLVADHQRVWARHQTISDLEHLLAARLLRRGRMDLVSRPTQTEVEVRNLADYDTALGIASGVEGGGAA